MPDPRERLKTRLDDQDNSEGQAKCEQSPGKPSCLDWHPGANRIEIQIPGQGMPTGRISAKVMRGNRSM
jgi:hypothetical protein